MIQPYSIARQDTGLFTGDTIFCAPGELAAHLQPGEVGVPDIHDPMTRRLVDGKVVEYPPPKPVATEDVEYIQEGERWVARETLAGAKKRFCAWVNAQPEGAPSVEYAGHAYQADAASRSRMAERVSLGQAATWRTADNVDVPLSADQLRELLAACVALVEQRHRDRVALKTRIGACQSVEEINALVNP